MEENIQVDTSSGGLMNNVQNNQLGFLKRIFGVFFWPGKTMECLSERPRILFPLLFVAITNAAMILSVLPMYKEYMRSILEAQSARMGTALTPEQYDRAINIAVFSSPFSVAAGVAAKLVIGSLILWGIIKIFKGQGNFKQVLSVTGYAVGMISVLSIIAKVVQIRLTGVFDTMSYTNLAVLMPKMDGNFFYGMAKFLDVFSIWQYAVIAIGVASVSRLPKKKAYMIVGAIFVILMLYAGAAEIMSAQLSNV
jgi:Yip1 domain.